MPYCSIVYQIEVEAFIPKLFILEDCYFYFSPEEAFEFLLRFHISSNWACCSDVSSYKPCLEQWTENNSKKEIGGFWICLRSHKHLIFRNFKPFPFESLIPVGFVPKTEMFKIPLHFPFLLPCLDQVIMPGKLMKHICAQQKPIELRTSMVKALNCPVEVPTSASTCVGYIHSWVLILRWPYFLC